MKVSGHTIYHYYILLYIFYIFYNSVISYFFLGLNTTDANGNTGWIDNDNCDLKDTIGNIICVKDGVSTTAKPGEFTYPTHNQTDGMLKCKGHLDLSALDQEM